MNTSRHCSFRTFWIGFCDWFANRTSMTHKDAWNEAKQQYGSFFPVRLLWLGVSILFLLVAAVALMPTMVESSAAMGVTSEHVRWVSQWGTVLVVGAIVGAFVVTKSIQIMRFCHEMCERGKAIEAKRLQSTHLAD